MKNPTLMLTTLTLCASPLLAAEWLHLPAKDGTANGKKIVLVSGDEEYRSVETARCSPKF